MRPTLKQMQYLVAIADTGKFNEAARVMNVSQPSLSTQIADMELELSVKLVERGRNGAILTSVGEDTVRRARAILRLVEELKATTQSGGGILSSRLRLGVIPSVGPYLLPEATKVLHRQYPDLRMSVIEERTIEIDRLLRDGRLDTIISTPEDHPDSISVPLFKENLWICVPPDSPLADKKGEVTLAELKGMPLLSLEHGHHLNLAIHELARQSGAFISREYEGTSLDAIRQMAAMGAGVAILPSLYALVEASRDTSLIVRRINHKNAQRQISLIWRQTSPLQESLNRLAEVFIESAKKLVG